MSHEITLEQRIARGKDAYARNDYMAALADFEEVSRREGGFADVHNLRGVCLSMLGRPEAAVEAFQQALALNPAFVGAHLNLAITLNDLGRLDDAREAFQRAAQADEERTSGPFGSAVADRLATRHAELGDLYGEAGALQQAAEQYRRACEIRPHFLDIRNKLGRALLDLGDLRGAATELSQVLSANPAFAGARANLGLALFRAGDLDGARSEWERCASQQPDNAQVAAYLGMLRRQDAAQPRG